MNNKKKQLLAKMVIKARRGKHDEAQALADELGIIYDRETTPTMLELAVGDELIDSSHEYTDVEYIDVPEGVSKEWTEADQEAYSWRQAGTIKGTYELLGDADVRALNLANGNWRTSHVEC